MHPKYAKELKLNDIVLWVDPDNFKCSREYVIKTIKHSGNMVTITDPDGDELQCPCTELVRMFIS